MRVGDHRKEKIMKRILVLGLLLGSPLAFADGLPCSIRPAVDTAAGALAGLAKVSAADALKAAMTETKATATPDAETELKIDQGCLVYSFYLRIAGATGAEAILIDAGNGQVLAHTHATGRQEAAERGKDKT
jgi:hypothetical protein